MNLQAAAQILNAYRFITNGIGADFIMIRIVEPVINHAVRDMCKMPYAGHPAGCPNFGRKRTCPPQAPLFEDIFDLTQPVYVIIYSFDMAIHRSKLRN